MMKNNKELYLHIGMPKTGTTTIQNFLFTNRDALLEKGYYYPRTLYEIVGPQSNVYRGSDLYTHFGESTPGLLVASQNVFYKFFTDGDHDHLDEVLKDMDESDAEKYIFSAEGIWFVPEAYRVTQGVKGDSFDALEEEYEKFIRAIKEKFESYDCKIIVYLRRQDLFIESYYAQLHQENMHVDFDVLDLLNVLNMNYSKKLDILAAVFGKENITVRPFEKSQWKEQDLVTDFMNTLHLEGEFERVPNDPFVVNSGLGAEYLAYKQTLYRNPPMTKLRGWRDLTNTLRNLSNHQSLTSPLSKPTYLAPKQRAALLEQFKDDNARVAEKYLTEGQDTLFEADPAFPKVSTATVTAQSVAQITGALFIETQTRVRELDRKSSQLKSAVHKTTQNVSKHTDRMNNLERGNAEDLQRLDGKLKQHETHTETLRSSVNKIEKFVDTSKLNTAAVKRDIGKLERHFKKRERKTDNVTRAIETNAARMVMLLWTKRRNGLMSRMRRWLRSEESIIRKSGLFDADFYLINNPDVREIGINPVRHYVQSGAAEFRNPSRTFDTTQYFAQNPSLAFKGTNPLVDYIMDEARRRS